MAGALFEPSFAAAHPAGLLRRPVTRTVVLAHRINAERALNDAYMAERNKPPSF